MKLRAAACAVVLASLGATGLACNDDPPRAPRNPFAYDAKRPLHAHVSVLERKRDVIVKRVTYAAADGSRVPALFAVPRHGRSLGCLIYQGGVGSRKEAAAAIWP